MQWTHASCLKRWLETRPGGLPRTRDGEVISNILSCEVTALLQLSLAYYVPLLCVRLAGCNTNSSPRTYYFVRLTHTVCTCEYLQVCNGPYMIKIVQQPEWTAERYAPGTRISPSPPSHFAPSNARLSRDSRHSARRLCSSRSCESYFECSSLLVTFCMISGLPYMVWSASSAVEKRALRVRRP